MPALSTPAQLSRRSDLFHQLAQMTAAGLGLIQALEILERNPPQAWMRAVLARSLDHLREGSFFSESLRRSGNWLSSFDIALIQAGEQSGRLPQCFKLLADYYAGRAQLVRQVIGFSIYPLLVFHMAVLIFPLSLFTGLILDGAVVPYVARKALVFGPIYGLAVFLWFGMQSTHGHAWRARVERVLSLVPVLGKARQQLAISRLCVALEALLNAGVTVIEAWDLAAAASGSPAIQRATAEMRPHLVAGAVPGEMIAGRPEFSGMFASLYQTGELSGQLDDSLRRCHVLFHDEGSRRLKTFIFGGAGILVGLVMLFAAFGIIQSWMGYFQQVNDAINMNK